MKKLDEREILRYLKDMLIESLNELREIGSEDENQFAYGEKTAYAECLEWIQMKWKEAKENGLDFDIEEIYPL